MLLLKTKEIETFLVELQRIQVTLMGTANLITMDPSLELKMMKSHNGKMKCQAITSYPSDSDAILKFTFNFDQLNLRLLIDDIEEVMIEFLVLDGEDNR